jgi:signal transduction histidine kinase
MPVHAQAKRGRTLPIRPTLVGIFAVPLISLVLLWGFAADTSIANAEHAHSYQSITPRVQPVLTALAQEQEQTYIWLATGRRAPQGPVAAAQAETDATAAAARSALESALSQFTPLAVVQLDAFLGQLDRLGTIRARVNDGTITPAAAFAAYSGIVDAAFQFFDTTFQSSDPTVAQESAGVTDAAYALEMTGREVTLVGGVLAAGGHVSVTVHGLFASAAANRQLLTSDALALMGPGMREPYAAANGSPAARRFAALEDQVATSDSAVLPVSPAAWQSAAPAYLAVLSTTMGTETATLDARAAQYGNELDRTAYLTGGLGLLAVVVSVILLVWFGRRVSQDLTGLGDSVRSMAEERLPRVVERLRRGDDVDVAQESPPPEAGTIMEIARVADAFATVQAAAVQAAVQQARLRKQVGQIFLNLSMRSQSLLQRQLRMLDALEQRATNPDDLANLFRLDHLTTRMRRNAEDLIILSGSVPSYGWTRPVPVIEVLRAAISEVEDYRRVDVAGTSRHSIRGGAVKDVVHLLAELIENATVFSPPDTQIQVRTSPVASGLAVAVEDRGLGLTTAELDQVNERLASPGGSELSNGEQLGLFIVSQIAARHGIQVTLKTSAFGGVVATVVLPNGVVARQAEADALARLGGRTAAPIPEGRSPEARRDQLSALQQGWQRGRADRLDDESEGNRP